MAIVTLDVKNAFNTARWTCILDALETMAVPTYLMRVITDYFRNRVLFYDSDIGTRGYRVTGGVPQGSVLGPLLWNVMYDGIFRLSLPEGSTVVCGSLQWRNMLRK